MVKRKAKGSDQSAVISDQSAEGDASPAPMSTSALLPQGDNVSAEYEIGMWAGKPHYRCLLCKFDTLNEDVMLGHIRAMHRPRFIPERAPSVLVADKRGNDVTSLTPSPSPEGRGGAEDEMFEVELKEVESTIDEQGNEHKTYTIKE